jgi:hypothetical protein
VSGQATGREYERIVKGEQPERRLGWRVDRGDWKVGGCVAAATDSSQLVMFIQRQLTFSYLNLAADPYPSLATNTNAMDIIFCRRPRTTSPTRATC